MASTDNGAGAARTRSPAYPSMPLKAAIERAKQMYDHVKRSPAHVDVVVEHWGYDSKSGIGLRAIAALKQFGLIEDHGKGKGESRQIRLTKRALELLFPEQHGGAEHASQLADAALAPKLYRALWEMYAGSLPADPVIRRFLILEKNFNDASVGRFLRDFRATISFANLGSSDTIHAESGDSEPQDDDMVATTEPTVKPAGQPAILPPPVPGAPYISFPLSDDNSIEIRLRRKVSPEDFERIKTLVDLSKSSLVEPQDD